MTRISIGVQSMVAAELVTLGRDHRFGDGPAAVARTIAAGFTTSVDFILGTPPRGAVPGEVPKEVSGGAVPEAASGLGSDHLSIYELTIEERTAFGKRVRDGRLVPFDEDRLTDLYIQTHEELTLRGFEHYEISSYARPGKRGVHNSLYWRGAPFLGLGVGAASLQHLPGGAGIRATNPRRSAAYLAAPGVPAEHTELSASEMAMDRAWLGLRTSDGIAEHELAAAPGIADELVADRLADRRDGRIYPTLRGFLMADRIASRIVTSWGDETGAAL